jgi:hypothetical protein
MIEIILMVLGTFFLTLALYFLFAQVFNISSLASSRYFYQIKNKQKKNDKGTGNLLWLRFIHYIGKKLEGISSKSQGNIDKTYSSREVLKHKLEYLEIDLTPEEFYASNFIRSLIIIAIGIPFLFVTPFISVGFFISAVLMFVGKIKNIDEAMKEYQRKIDFEMVSFSATIEEELKHDKSIPFIFNNYVKFASKPFKDELAIAIMDINSSNTVDALLRLDQRVNNKNLTSIIQMLLEVDIGNKKQDNFSRLTDSLRRSEKDWLKLESKKRIKEIDKYVWIITGSAVLMATVPLITVLYETVVTMFGG